MCCLKSRCPWDHAPVDSYKKILPCLVSSFEWSSGNFGVPWLAAEQIQYLPPWSHDIFPMCIRFHVVTFL